MLSSTPPTIKTSTDHHQPPLWTLTFLTFLFINFFIFMGFNMLLPTLSLYLEGQGCTKEEIGLIFGTFAISSVTFRLLASRFSYRYGAIRVVKIGLLICSVGTLLFFVVPLKGFYMMARMMHGAGYGLTSTLMVSLAAQLIPPSRLGEGLGYLGLGATSALAIGPLTGLYLYEHFQYQVMFIFISFCYLGAILISLTLPTIILPSDLTEESKDRRALIEPKALPPSFLALMYGACCCSVSSYLAIYCLEINMPYSADFFVISTIGILIARLTSGRVYDHYGHFYVIPPAIVLVIAALLTILLIPSRTTLYIASVVYGLGAGMIFPALQALTLSSVSEKKQTAASASFLNFFDIGISLGTIFLGFLAGHYHTYKAVFAVSPFFIIMMLLTYLLYYCLHKKKGFTRS